MNNDNDILIELLYFQIKNIPNKDKLKYTDIVRIAKNITVRLMDKQCCIYKSPSKTYSSFYFNHKKTNLKRLIYMNFIGPLSPNEYVKTSCNNAKNCINMRHMHKYKYSKNQPLIIHKPIIKHRSGYVNKITVSFY